MEMVKLESMDDWENLPLNKRKIKEPLLSEKRQNALETGNALVINNSYVLISSWNKALINFIIINPIQQFHVVLVGFYAFFIR